MTESFEGDLREEQGSFGGGEAASRGVEDGGRGEIQQNGAGWGRGVKGTGQTAAGFQGIV